MTRRRIGHGLTLQQANRQLYGDQWMSYIWRRAECIDRLSRDEFPWEGWDREFPDLAAERLAKLAEEKP